MNAELPERPIVFGADVGAEDQVGIGGAMQPAILLNLALELPAPPSRIAERQQPLPRTAAFSSCLEDVQRGVPPNTLLTQQPPLLPHENACTQYQPAPRP